MESFAVISDIHGNLPALEAVIEDLENKGISQVINLGDMFSGPLWPQETAQLLMSKSWFHVAGNHDIQIISNHYKNLGLSDAYAYNHLDAQQKMWLASHPQTIILLGEEVFACHGTPQNPNQYLTENIEKGRMKRASREIMKGRLSGFLGSTIILCGHSHIPRCIQLDDQLTIINPGSVGQPAYIDDEYPPHIMEIGSPHARYAIVEKKGPFWSCQFITIKYDWHYASKKAYKENRNDWGYALESGFARES